MTPATTTQLYAMLPPEPNGAPSTPGWYFCERVRGRSSVFVEVRADGTLLAGTGRVIYPRTVSRHAPLLLRGTP